MSPKPPAEHPENAEGEFATRTAASTEAASGVVIGPYHLLELIGEGGMGEVWLAEQKQPVRRRVAIKLIKAGMDTREVVARFESERQALALMDHPAIAKVFDAGSTPEGRPYFVMEYVAGIPITAYCDKHKLTVRQRMELFIQVCEGVQHAHQKAIIHRDLKPSNILVSEVDGKPMPRIIDFGVAKATSQKLTAGTMYTRVGTMRRNPRLHEPGAGRLRSARTSTPAPTSTRSAWCSMSCWWARCRSISRSWPTTKCCAACASRMRRGPARSCARWAATPPLRRKTAAPILPRSSGNCAATRTPSRSRLSRKTARGAMPRPRSWPPTSDVICATSR